MAYIVVAVPCGNVKKKFPVVAKMMALVIAMVMMVAMGVTAFADTTGTITIKSSEKDTEYNFYKILDLTGQDTSSPADGTYDAVAYTIDSNWEGFFTNPAAGASYLIAAADATAAQKSTLNQINWNGSVYYLNLTDSNVVAFTNAAMEYALDEDNNISADETKTGTGSDVAASGLALGYYLMIPVDASIKTANSSGSVASITSTIPNADILVKAVKPSIEKEDDTITADIGKTVTYTITGTVPNTAGYETYTYKVWDKMSTGLTFNQDVVIKVAGDSGDVTLAADAGATVNDYAVSYAETGYTNGFVADIHVTKLQDYIGKTITITYTATVNADAVTVDQATNSAKLEYGHNPDDTEETTEIKEEVYSAKVIINKYTGDDATSGTKLANASFALMKMDGTTAKFYKYTAASGDDPAKVEWVTVTGAPTSGTAAVTDAMATALATAAGDGTITGKTTGADGAAEFIGVADGTYYLVEYAAPDGYNRLDTPESVTVTGTDVDTDANHVENEANSTGVFDSANNATADIQNNTGSVLPSTGGIGTTIFYVIGAILVLGAGILLVTRRRMNAN